MPEERTAVDVEGRRVVLTHLDRVLYPEAGFTKAAVLQYYSQVAPLLLPHLVNRPVSLLRCPEGVTGERFWAKRLPAGAPDWVRTLEVAGHKGAMHQPVITDLATLTWAANLNALEIHAPQWRTAPDRHDRLIIDLDPGEGTGMVHCCAAALAAKAELAEDGLDAWPKTSGSKGLHLVVPLRPAPAEQVNAYAKQVAQRLKSAYPELIVNRMNRDLRQGRVFVDWSQNASAKTTVVPYSLRALAAPTASTPLTWAEVAAAGEPGQLSFTADQVLDRIARHGDLMAPLLDPDRWQDLPAG